MQPRKHHPDRTLDSDEERVWWQTSRTARCVGGRLRASNGSTIAMHCKFTIVRPDRVEHNDNVNDRIISEIRSCQFMVADFTLHRNGVYFEAGLASGLGRPVICT